MSENTFAVPTKQHIENLNYLSMISENVLQQYRNETWCGAF